jgi:hypothetical protein
MKRRLLWNVAVAVAVVLPLARGESALAQAMNGNRVGEVSSSASARVANQLGVATNWYWPGYSYWPGYAGYWGPWSSTTAEGYWRGRAEWLRARGEYNSLTAMAQQTREEARGRAIENRVKATEAYFEQKRENRRYQKEMASQRTTVAEARAVERDHLPPLTAAQLDPISGRIQWPAALQSPVFGNSRAALEAHFAESALADQCDPQTKQQVSEVADSLLTQLKSRIGEMNSMEYVQAKKFVEGLKQAAGCESRRERLANR